MDVLVSLGVDVWRLACDGWLTIVFVKSRFAYAVLAADELVAVSNAIKFRYEDGRTSLVWEVGESVDNAVWICVFLTLVIIVNLFPVKVQCPRFRLILRPSSVAPFRGYIYGER